jgi:hypothetical protein
VHRDSLNEAGDCSGLVETVCAAQDLDATVAEQLVASLLERERSVLEPFAERWRTLCVALRKRYPELLRLPSLWTRSYFCSTAGNVSNATVERYISEQKNRD